MKPQLLLAGLVGTTLAHPDQASKLLRRKRNAELETGRYTTPEIVWQSDIVKSTGLDVSRLDRQYFSAKWNNLGWKHFGVGLVYAFDLPLGSIGIWEECGKEDKSLMEVYKCIGSFVATGAGIVAVANFHREELVHLGDRIKFKAIEVAVNFIAPEITRFRPFIGPFRNFGNSAASPIKRAVELVGRAEDLLTTHLGARVEHIGVWDGSTPGAPGQKEARDTDEPMQTPVPVFAVHKNDVDMHFALFADPVTGQTRVRAGHGPGPETEVNTRRLKARSGDRPAFNSYFFDKGGIDMVGVSDDLPGVPEGEQLDPETSGAYDLIYDSVQCELAAMGSFPDNVKNFAGAQWQLYDHKTHGTAAVGVFVALAPGYPSPIDSLQPRGALSSSLACKHDRDELRRSM